MCVCVCVCPCPVQRVATEREQWQSRMTSQLREEAVRREKALKAQLIRQRDQQIQMVRECGMRLQLAVC